MQFVWNGVDCIATEKMRRAGNLFLTPPACAHCFRSCIDTLKSKKYCSRVLRRKAHFQSACMHLVYLKKTSFASFFFFFFVNLSLHYSKNFKIKLAITYARACIKQRFPDSLHSSFMIVFFYSSMFEI